MRMLHYIFRIAFSKNLPIKFLLVLILIKCSINVKGQGSLSASTKSILHTIQTLQLTQRSKKIQIPEQLQKELHIFSKNDVQYINALVKVNLNEIDIASLSNLGIHINTKAGDIWTAQIPVDVLEKVSTVKGVIAIDMGGKMKLLLDAARKDTRADDVHQGINLLKSYQGENVVVGIIDIGFDYTHPTFYDSASKKCRISRIWNQFYTEDGGDLGLLPPKGYNYGVEIVNPDDKIKSLDISEYKDEIKRFYVSDGTEDTHGTHVAGIAVGSGWGTQGQYKGIAPKAEIVMVTVKDEEWSSADIIDAMQYIYDYAASVNKPAVINFSAGTDIGPHDGTSLLCHGFNNLTGEGKIIVGAAGNSGGEQDHLMHTFNTLDSAFTLIGYYAENTLHTNFSNEVIDCWGSANSDFFTKIIIYNKGKKIGETKFIAASLNGVLTDTIYEDTDTAFVKFTTEYVNPNNKRPNILIDISTSKLSTSLSYHLALKGENTQVHAWGRGFLSTEQPKYIAGDDAYTIVDGQTAEKMIAVGAYATINKYINLNNQEQNYENEIEVGNILYFSSHGPTVDGRIKPDITAPGFIKSSISSLQNFDGEEEEFGSEVYSLTSPVNGRMYKFAAESGTSMASPVVTGAVALMLEANPKLNQQQVMDVLKKTARQDQFTGNIPVTGSNIWGWGKVNVYNAVKSVEVNKKKLEIVDHTAQSFIHPNPAKDIIKVVLPEGIKNTPCTYQIFNQLGKKLKSDKVSSKAFDVSISDLSKGSYIIKITDGNVSFVNKFIKE